LQTLWVCALALQELAGPAAETAETATDVISLVTRTGLIEQLVLALLVLFSVFSWGIVAYKTWAFRKAPWPGCRRSTEARARAICSESGRASNAAAGGPET